MADVGEMRASVENEVPTGRAGTGEASHRAASSPALVGDVRRQGSRPLGSSGPRWPVLPGVGERHRARLAGSKGEPPNGAAAPRDARWDARGSEPGDNGPLVRRPSALSRGTRAWGRARAVSPWSRATVPKRRRQDWGRLERRGGPGRRTARSPRGTAEATRMPQMLFVARLGPWRVGRAALPPMWRHLGIPDPNSAIAIWPLADFVVVVVGAWAGVTTRV